jgi:hypothetical protein
MPRVDEGTLARNGKAALAIACRRAPCSSVPRHFSQPEWRTYPPVARRVGTSRRPDRAARNATTTSDYPRALLASRYRHVNPLVPGAAVPGEDDRRPRRNRTRVGGVSDVSVRLPPRPDAFTCRLCGDEFVVKTGTTATLAALIALDAHRVRDHDVWPSSMSRNARSARDVPTRIR